jgi:hypothetical protein
MGDKIEDIDAELDFKINNEPSPLKLKRLTHAA